ncbi:MAG: hypothetical protein AAF467_12205 [Actinomycetota bacterium]
MSSTLIAGLIAAGVVLLGIIIYVSWRVEKARRATWARWAAERGWSYSHERDRSVSASFQFLDRLRRGNKRYAKDVMRGVWRDREMIAFTYHYETESTDSEGNRTTTSHWLNVVALKVDQHRHFPELSVVPENVFRRIGNLFTNNDIDFESIEFSKQYEVRADDKKFAYDVCHARMIEYLMANPRTTFELEGQWIATVDTNKLKLDRIEPSLDHLDNIVALLPDYLFRD